MQRKETYATTGPRMMVRFFGGWDYTEADMNSRQPAFRGYEKGVPMGGDLQARQGQEGPQRSWSMPCVTPSAPISTASRSSRAGWTASGKTHEKGLRRGLVRRPQAGRQGQAARRWATRWTSRTRTGPTPSALPSWRRCGPIRISIRAQRAFYYARVLEIPTPRWIVYDAFRYGIEIPQGATTDRSGARLHLADLVHAGHLRPGSKAMRGATAMSGLARLWREPLVHFLLLGAALFAAFGVMQERGDEGPDRIVVDASQVQQLAARFKRTWLRAPTQEELVGLVEGYVREEVYYREALAMGLDRNDPVVRNGMRVKLEFLLEELTAEDAPGDEALNAYLRQHADRISWPQVSFRQRLPESRQTPGSRGRRQAHAVIWRKARRPPRWAIGRSCRRSTSWQPRRRSHDCLAIRLLQDGGDRTPGDWAGPVYSGFGVHVVKVTERKEGHPPALAEVRAQVEREYLARRRTEFKEMRLSEVARGYEVVIDATTAPDRGAGQAVAADRPELAAQ